MPCTPSNFLFFGRSFTELLGATTGLNGSTPEPPPDVPLVPHHFEDDLPPPLPFFSALRFFLADLLL